MTDSRSLRATLFSFHDRLAGSNITWAITASANLMLQGLDVTPNDIDVMTDAEGAYRIEELFSDHVIRPIQPPELAMNDDKDIRSHYGVLSLDGIDVDLMGSVEHRIDGEWVPFDTVVENREYIERDGRDIPVMSLDHELTGYRNLGRGKRVAQVEAHLGRGVKGDEDMTGDEYVMGDEEVDG
jgi:hypothetical protein